MVLFKLGFVTPWQIMKQFDKLDTRFKPALDDMLEKVKHSKELKPVEESDDDKMVAVEEPKPLFRSRLLNR